MLRRVPHLRRWLFHCTTACRGRYGRTRGAGGARIFASVDHATTREETARRNSAVATGACRVVVIMKHIQMVTYPIHLGRRSLYASIELVPFTWGCLGAIEQYGSSRALTGICNSGAANRFPTVMNFYISLRKTLSARPPTCPVSISVAFTVWTDLIFVCCFSLQGPDDAIRDRAAAVLAALPLCSEGDAWTLAAGKVTLEAHGCVLLSLSSRLLGEARAFGTFNTQEV